MIVVKVELHSAITGKVSEIGRMHISNTTTFENGSRANYFVRLFRRGSFKTSPVVVQREGEVNGHARKSAPVWKLVQKALKAVGY
jgi:hypothetical protein